MKASKLINSNFNKIYKSYIKKINLGYMLIQIYNFY